MEQRQQLLLQFGLEVDQQIAAAQQVEAGEGWVHHQVLRREDDHLADLVAHPIAVIVLHDIEGVPHTEIARILGVSEGTVRSRLFYARRLLQGLLSDYL